MKKLLCGALFIGLALLPAAPGVWAKGPTYNSLRSSGESNIDIRNECGATATLLRNPVRISSESRIVKFILPEKLSTGADAITQNTLHDYNQVFVGRIKRDGREQDIAVDVPDKNVRLEERGNEKSLNFDFSAITPLNDQLLRDPTARAVVWRERRVVTQVNPFYVRQDTRSTFGIGVEAGTDERRFQPQVGMQNGMRIVRVLDSRSAAGTGEDSAAKELAQYPVADSARAGEFNEHLWHVNVGGLWAKDHGDSLGSAGFILGAVELYKPKISEGTVFAPTTYDTVSATAGYFNANNLFTQEYLGLIERHVFNRHTSAYLELDGSDAHLKHEDHHFGLLTRGTLRYTLGKRGDSLLLTYLPRNVLGGGAGAITYEAGLSERSANSFRVSYTTDKAFIASLIIQVAGPRTD